MTTRQIWEIDDYNRIIDGTTKVLLFTVDTSSDDDPLPIMRKIAAAPAMYAALKLVMEMDRTNICDEAIVCIAGALAQAEGTNR